jgi:hypothetical protein
MAAPLRDATPQRNVKNRQAVTRLTCYTTVDTLTRAVASFNPSCTSHVQHKNLAQRVEVRCEPSKNELQ